MIDVISSSIRVGHILRGHQQLKIMYDFFESISSDNNNPIAFEYKKLITSKFIRYGFYAFEVVDKIIEQNLENEDEIARSLSERIKEFLLLNKDYGTVLIKSKEYGAILNDYVAEMLRNPSDFTQMKIENISLKLQQSSNELSTAILRSGVLSWLIDPQKFSVLKKNISFLEEYDKKIEPFEHLPPYNSNTVKIINNLNKVEQKIAYHIENVRLIQFLVRNGIVQGFFFELFEIPKERILRIKELHTDQSIHPVVIKTDFIYPSDHLIFFRYRWNNKISYLLTKRMKISFYNGEADTMLYGYCYPTNEYSLLKID